VTILLASQSAGAPGSAAPIGIRSASLTQSGQLLVWRATLAHPFSPSVTARAGGSLCLLISAARTDTLLGRLCVEPPRRNGRAPRLFYARGASGSPQQVTATVTRPSARAFVATFLPAELGLDYRPLRWQVQSTLGPPACTAAPACTVLVPTRPVLVRLHVPRVVGCVPSGAPFVASGPTNRRAIALTFDDGPWPDTPQFLALLEREHVRATFFQIGEQVGTYGQTVDRRMLADRDMIGDHTWSHANVARGGPFAAAQIDQAAAAIRGVTGGFTPCLFRPPGGAYSAALIDQARALGFTTIEWNVDPRDWSRPGSDAIYQNVVSNARNGAIVIQHDGGGDRSQTLAALPREIDALRKAGYQFVTITDLLGQRLVYR
jgi:peptidoglycan/xylan/chitin deacetylase (PgdA/CDA1 family)